MCLAIAMLLGLTLGCVDTGITDSSVYANATRDASNDLGVQQNLDMLGTVEALQEEGR